MNLVTGSSEIVGLELALLPPDVEGKEDTQELKFVKEDGAWKIDFIPDEMRGMLEGIGGAAGAEGMKEMGEKLQKAMGDQIKKAMEDAAKEAEGGE